MIIGAASIVISALIFLGIGLWFGFCWGVVEGQKRERMRKMDPDNTDLFTPVGSLVGPPDPQ